ncbi:MULTISPECIES: hypothetical protein [Salipiger]|uniref:Uncharacterized protein n=1 Tax=Salipiger profundus TaxID=1229727 RepID=A0A1U7CZE4_9RHOB|nr:MULTISPECIES: hypothetical protein [Salipiger]ALF02050.1 hypothetical protein vBThpSP1_011 [Thiobacimonas phage vB_ThpS-P1]APX21274.1 hypothetical protein Ga0080559_TMP478 [Salipiger profundus]GGA03649.1 hypothetical protein GCM10011326_13790 [Salipiger profundus]
MNKFNLKFHMIGGAVITVPSPDLSIDDVEEELREHGVLSISSASGEETVIFRQGVAAICLVKVPAVS